MSCLEHDTGAVKCVLPQRQGPGNVALRTGVADHIGGCEAPRATRGPLRRVHDASLLEAVVETRSAQPVELDADTMLSPQSAEAALRAAGAGVAAVDAVMEDEASSAFCAVRPPGHHATAHAAMGFCLFNKIGRAHV